MRRISQSSSYFSKNRALPRPESVAKLSALCNQRMRVIQGGSFKIKLSVYPNASFFPNFFGRLLLFEAASPRLLSMTLPSNSSLRRPLPGVVSTTRG